MENNNEIFEVTTNETDPTPEVPVEAVPEVEVPVEAIPEVEAPVEAVPEVEVPVEAVPEVEVPVAEVPQQTWQAQPVPPPVGEQKSKLVAGLLQIFFGGLGIGRFYLGYTTIGIFQILTSFLCGAGVIWGFIDGIMILTGSVKTDAKGIPLRD
ncbi:MAG: NINE protein [Oscillospiraceae bacterium]|nr:NINE protein [Oscillospiraceae bacterium]